MYTYINAYYSYGRLDANLNWLRVQRRAFSLSQKGGEEEEDGNGGGQCAALWSCLFVECDSRLLRCTLVSLDRNRPMTA